tara:strand:- start:97 stop:324 length:228 start_codon:yes stop_codon:yes gene_type:complete
MKKIKSILTGFLFATLMFLFMGQTTMDNNIGRYQLHQYAVQGYTTKLYETIFDTKTGQVIIRTYSNESDYKSYKK